MAPETEHVGETTPVGVMTVPRPNPCRLTLVHPDESAAVTDALWARLRAEAEEAYQKEPKLASLFFDSILNQPSFETAVFHRVAARMRNDVVSLSLIVQAFAKACVDDPCIVEASKADIAAVLDRDPACSRLLEPLLYFKGFHAIQAHRLNHWLWHHGERDFALYLQSRSSEVFQTDIHPNAKFGMGIFLDHATDIVVGETAELGDNVSMLQGVTLGGTGKEAGDRHPKIRQGVVIGAAAKVLGNIEIGEHARIAAGSVVLKPVPPHATVAGVPAKIVRVADTEEPALSMDQML
jgi:serine O-acetyltransferase